MRGPAILIMRLKRDDDFRYRTAASYPKAFEMLGKVVNVGPASLPVETSEFTVHVVVRVEALPSFQ